MKLISALLLPILFATASAAVDESQPGKHESTSKSSSKKSKSTPRFLQDVLPNNRSGKKLKSKMRNQKEDRRAQFERTRQRRRLQKQAQGSSSSSAVKDSTSMAGPQTRRRLIFDWLWEIILDILRLLGIVNDDEPTNDDDDEPIDGMFDPCVKGNGIVYFAGHTSIVSSTEGEVQIEWIPPFIFSSDAYTDNTTYTGIAVLDFYPVYCGSYTYDVFYYDGDWTIDTTSTIDELIALAETDGSLQHIETTELSTTLEGLTGGSTYTILVTAKVEGSHESMNRLPARVQVSSVVLDVNANFTELVVLPEPVDDSFVVIYDQSEGTVSYTGTLPIEMDDIDPLDYMYVQTADGDAYILLVNDITADTASSFQASVTEVDFGAFFNEIEFSSDVFDPTFDTDEIEVSDEEVQIIVEAFSANQDALRDVCTAVEPDNVEGCIAEVNGNARRILRERHRRLFCCKKLVNSVKKAVDTVKKVVEEVVEVIVEVVDTPFSFSADATLIDLDKAVVLGCSGTRGALEYNMELAIGFYFSLGVRFYLRASLISGVREAEMSTYGAFGIKAYAFMEASISREYEPDPIELIKYSKTKNFQAGPVPIIVTFRPFLEAYFTAAASLEGTLFFGVSKGYEFEAGFEYAKGSGFSKTSSFDVVDPPVPDPLMELRLGLEAETGFTFNFDVVLYGALQGTLSVDLGLAADLELSADLDTMLVTRPYPVAITSFGVDFTAGVRLFVGLNRALADVLRELPSLSGDDSEWPVELDAEEEESVTEEAVQLIIGGANVADFTTVDGLLGQLGLTDTYEEVTGAINEFVDAGFGFEFEVFSISIPILRMPNIAIVLEENSVQICNGQNAIQFILTYELEYGEEDDDYDADSLVENGFENEIWFANFDGEYIPLDEPTGWIIDLLGSGNSRGERVLVRLPRTGTNDDYEIPVDDGSIFVRATPDILPIPAFGLGSADLQDIFEGVDLDDSFQCCEDADCVRKFGGTKPVCDDDGTCLDAPSATPTTAPSASPSTLPTTSPSQTPTSLPSETPTRAPSSEPSIEPTTTQIPSSTPTLLPSADPTGFYFEVDPEMIVYGVEADPIFGYGFLRFELTDDIFRDPWFELDPNFPCGSSETGMRSLVEIYYVDNTDADSFLGFQCLPTTTTPGTFDLPLDYDLCSSAEWTQKYKLVFVDKDRPREIIYRFPTVPETGTVCTDNAPDGAITCSEACQQPNLQGAALQYIQSIQLGVEGALRFLDPVTNTGLLPEEEALFEMLNDDDFVVTLGLGDVQWSDSLLLNDAARNALRQRYAALSLYYSVDENERDSVTGRIPSNDTVCDWSIFTCNTDGEVTALTLAPIGNLIYPEQPEFEDYWMSDPVLRPKLMAFSGEVGLLDEITTITGRNALKGTIPSSLSRLPVLVAMDVSLNTRVSPGLTDLGNQFDFDNSLIGTIVPNVAWPSRSVVVDCKSFDSSPQCISDNIMSCKQVSDDDDNECDCGSLPPTLFDGDCGVN